MAGTIEIDPVLASPCDEGGVDVVAPPTAEEIASRYLGIFWEHKYDYSDETPSEDVREIIKREHPGTTRLIRYKCQRSYTYGLRVWLTCALSEDGLIDDELAKAQIETFLQSDLNFQPGDVANPQRMARVNGVLDSVIGHLTPKVPVELRPQPSPLQTQ
jgi:hypothetical protein